MPMIENPAKAPRVIIAEDTHGETIVIGPVYTGKGAVATRALIERQPGWTIRETAPLLSKAQLEWNSQ
jgi:hypothetical protein